MIVVNFSHPLTDQQKATIENLSGQGIADEMTVAVHVNDDESFQDQIQGLFDTIPLTATQWQTESLLIVLPGYSPVAAVIIAEFHGRTGYFPTCIRIRPVHGSDPPAFEVAELLPLNQIRSAARQRRFE